MVLVPTQEPTLFIILIIIVYNYKYLLDIPNILFDQTITNCIYFAYYNCLLLLHYISTHITADSNFITENNTNKTYKLKRIKRKKYMFLFIQYSSFII